jgi:processive 1,2-diacylglycerol beta-glucosyltransferase
MKKKILILMLEVGLGHKIPALAIKEELEMQYPDAFDIAVVDFAKEVGAARTDRQLNISWDIALKFPVFVRIGYRYMEMNRKNFFYIELLYRDFIQKGMQYIANTNPDIVLATHALCIYIASKARRIYGGNYKILSYVVDPFDGYSLWANPESDMFLVATEQSKSRLLDHGIKDSNIIITGFPTRRAFFDLKKSKEDIFSELALDFAKITILISAGSQGISNVYSFAKTAKRKNIPLNLIVVTGKNQKLKRSLDNLVHIKNEMNFAVLSYVDNMNELIAASDVVAGKAGASTFMEAMFMKKPMIFTGWTAYNDWYIIKFALDKQIGWYCPNLASFLNILKKLSKEPYTVLEYQRRIEALRFVPGTKAISEIIAGIAGQ